MHCMLTQSGLGRRARNCLASRAAGKRPTALLLAGMLAIVATPLSSRVGAVERDVMSPTEMDQIGLVQAWRRHLSVPVGTQSIIDHKLYVHKTSPKQYVEVVGKIDAANAGDPQKPAAPGESGGADQAATNTAKPSDTGAKGTAGQPPAASVSVEPPVYARYLLEIPDIPEKPEPETPETEPTKPETTSQSTLARMTMSGKASFASSGLLDRTEAERRARNDIRRLKRRGIEAEIRFREVPTIRMYTLADDGTLECRDAETGEIVWLQRVGNRAKGYSGFGVDDRFLTVVNGSELIKLDSVKGGVYDVQQLTLIPTRGPQHCGDFAVVPSVGYRMVAYPLSDEHRDPLTETVYGDALASPTLAIGSDKLAWGTAREFIYVLEVSGEPTMDFRLNTDGVVNGKLAAASGNRFYFGSSSGQIYGLRATRTGEVIWTRPTGDPIHEAPVVFNDRVLFLSTDGNLMCVDAATGADCWDSLAHGVELVIGVIGDRIYVRTLSGTMEVLDAADGKVIYQLPGMRPHIWSTNIVSDRLYLLDKHGSIQCLRRPDAEMPTLTVSTEVIPAEDATQEKEKKSKTPAKEAPDANDPFGGGADPFGGGADPFGGGGADPFGGGNDPF